MIHHLKYLGPGLLYAGAAIGVSHLVQSTRAGADFGLGMIWVIVLANLLKYPFFKMGPLYASYHKESLLHGYKNLGNWALWLFLILTVSTMFAVIAAITAVTAGLAENLIQLNLSIPYWSGFILLFSLLILILGKYSFLDRIIKGIIILLSLTTSLAFLMACGIEKTSLTNAAKFDWSNNSHIFFLIAFIGWMPAPMDISIWHSAWSVEKQRSELTPSNLKRVLLDFNIGYIGTVVLAIFFLVLGAQVFHGSNEELSSGGVQFAGQLIGMYNQLLGDWAFYLIAIAAFTTMFSTCITCLDAFPRVVSEAIVRMRKAPLVHNLQYYKLGLVSLSLGAFLCLVFFLQSMKQMVDFATTVSFVTTPILATMNYMVMRKSELMGTENFPSYQKILIWAGFVFVYGFTFYFLFQKYLA